MKQVLLSPEKMRAFDEFIWRAMGRLGDDASRDLLDPNSEIGKLARAYYEELAEGKPWSEMVDFLTPTGSDVLPEHLSEASPRHPDRATGD
jgi:hypothetical protein